MAAVSQDSEVAVLQEETSALATDPALACCEFTFPGDVASIAASREEVMQWLREYCCDEADEIDWTVALQEALANAAFHGCGNDAGKAIGCSVEVGPTQISVVVRDPGPGFDFHAVADPDRFSPTTLEHGRGIALMRGMVDEVNFGCGGSEVRLLKRMNCRAASPVR